MDTVEVTDVLDVKGLKCPMPLVKTRNAVKNIEVGQVLQIVATDKGSVADFKGWAKTAKNVELVGQSTEDASPDTLYIHLIKRTK